MKKLIILSLVLFFVFLQFAQAQPVPDKDTAWTKDLRPETITGAKFTPDGSKIVVTTMEKIRVYDTETGEVLKYYDVSNITNNIGCMDLHPGGRYIVTGDLSKTLVWDLETGDTIKSLNIVPYPVKYSADGNEILINYMYDNAWAYNELVKWNLITGDTTTNVLKATIYAMNISKDGRYFAIGVNYPYCYLYLWDYQTMTEIEVLVYHESRIQDIDFSPDGKYIASAGYDGYIKIWNLENKNLYKSIKQDSGFSRVETVRFSPDSKFFVSGHSSGYNNISIWNIETEKLIKNFNHGATNSLEVDINAKYIVATSGSFLYLLNAYWEPNDVDEEQPKDTIKLYPNPTTGFVSIQFHQPFSEITNIYLSGMNGQIVKPILNNYLEEGSITIDFDTHDITSGSYFVKVENTHLSLIFKLIVNK